ncbi:Rv1355c family protein [Williamsia maris]|uniref:Molybdopterin or thiamine biosynthesis adenylyltransferase n=1 Tax=Williamsia maris TaxID=72806 RepID=A0ABT1HI91_9NOCA|nr:Rv1355c family protein [Williamsia maris]MCP2177076.1 Molybdopterin or thiamine biosynthesis adenylyltransferase [Williamsia maris]
MTDTQNATTERAGSDDAVVEILDESNAADRARLVSIEKDQSVRRLDTLREQQISLAAVIPPPDDALLTESPRWVYYPWRSSLVRMLGPDGFRRLRLDRNRNKITAAEQDRLTGVTVGVLGLSVGHAVAHTLAVEGLAGTIRLMDFDTIDLSNLNRVPGSVFDLGVNKAVVAARRIAELDPYLRVEIAPGGLDEDTVADFLDGLDIVLEECDSFDAKVIVRDHARARGIPVIMETSDGGVLDVERFDLDGERPLFHGLLGEIDAAALSGLTTAQKVPLGITLLDAARVTARMAASAVELGRTISTWPQLGGDVALGGATCAAAVRRLALGYPLPSGRIRVDLDAELGSLVDPLTATPPPPRSATAPDDVAVTFGSLPDREAVVYAGMRAPSAGNAQPWAVSLDDTGVTVTLRDGAQRGDIDRRASAVALGAMAFNIDVAAAARSVAGHLAVTGSGSDLALRYSFGDGADPQRADLLDAMLRRATDRRPGDGSPLSDDEVDALDTATRVSGGFARIVTDRAALVRCGGVLAASDRIRRLTPALHAEMVAEVRWPDSDADPRTGLTLDTLGVGRGGLGMLAVTRRSDVMALLAEWDAGSALGAPTQGLVASGSAIVAICQDGDTSADHVRGGTAAQAMWVRACELGLSICPVTPVSLHARDDTDREALSPGRADELSRLDAELRALFGVDDGRSIAMVVRVFRADGAPPVSLRRAQS